MNKSNIPSCEDDDGPPRDERAIHHQRAVLITHPNTLQRYQEYHNRGLDLGNAVLAVDNSKQKKRLKQAIKRKATKSNTEKKKAEEKERRSKMTKEELQLEKEENKMKANERKRKREERDKEDDEIVELAIKRKL
jgi:hypothetical protein